MIAARQMRFIGKVVRGPWSRPAKRMLTACCANIRLAQRPNFHNKDLLVKNLKLLFANVHDVEIDNQGSMKEWINEVMDEEYWNQLVECLTDKFAELPERPETWRRRRRSPRGHEESRREQPWPPTPPRQNRDKVKRNLHLHHLLLVADVHHRHEDQPEITTLTTSVTGILNKLVDHCMIHSKFLDLD